MSSVAVMVSAESSAIGLLPQKRTPCPYIPASAIASQLAFSGFLKYDVPSTDQFQCLRPNLLLYPGVGDYR
jgi:hypothetical protein